jgi:ureidoglycolate lyase
MKTRALQVRLLTRRAFAPFGDVIETRTAKSYLINNDTTRRYHDLARVDVRARSGRPLLNIFRAQATSLPFEVREVERHPLGSQAFIPLDRLPYLVVVARSAPGGAPGRVHAFVANGDQGVNYRRGVWHHPLMALDSTSDFLVIDRGGAGKNCDVQALCDIYRISVVPTPVPHL